MRKLFAVALALLVSSAAFSQLDEKIRQEGVVPATIIIKGKETEGYMKRMGTRYWDDIYYSTPWEFQGKVRFISKRDFDKKDKIKNKDYSKYTAKDISGYRYNGDSLVYLSVKYADNSAVGTGMIPKTKFMRRISDNKISIFHHFQTPPSVGEVSALKEIYLENKNPDVVYKKGKKGKLRLVNALNVGKELEDCPTVVEKYKNGEYKVAGSEEKQSKAAKLLNKTVFRDGVRMMVIEDYNNTCN